MLYDFKQGVGMIIDDASDLFGPSCQYDGIV